MEGGRAALAAHVHIDGEEDLAALLGLPLGGEGLAAVIVRRVAGVDAAGVVLERRAVEDLVGVGAAALVGLVEVQDVGAVQVRLADVAAGLAAVLVVEGVDVGEVVAHARLSLQSSGQRAQREAGRGDAVVGRARVVLDLLDEDEIGEAELVHNLVDDAGQMGRVGGQVLRVVGRDSDATAVAGAVEGYGRKLGGGFGNGGDGGKRQEAVKAKGVVDDTSDVAKVVAELRVVGVLRAIQGSADDDGLGIGIWYEISNNSQNGTVAVLTPFKHGDTAVSIDTSGAPVAAHPDVAKVVGTAGLVRTLDGDELAYQALPKVQTVLGRLERGVGHGDEVDGIGDAKDAADIEAGVVLGGGREGVDGNDKRLDRVAAGADHDVGGTAELGELDIVFVGS